MSNNEFILEWCRQWCRQGCEADNISVAIQTASCPTLRVEESKICIVFNPRSETEFVSPYLDKMKDGFYENDETLTGPLNFVDNPWLS